MMIFALTEERCTYARLIKSIPARSVRGVLRIRFHIGAKAVIWHLAAEQLAGDVVVDLHLEARRRVTVVVGPNKVHVTGGGCHDTGDGVRALINWCTLSALRHVVLSCVAADTSGRTKQSVRALPRSAKTPKMAGKVAFLGLF